MSKPDAPPAPDYVGAAQAQGAANVEAARTSAKLNNANYITPFGNQVVSYGVDGDPDRATVTQTLSPAQQALLEQSNRINQSLGNVAEGGISRVNQMLGTQFDMSKVPAAANSVNAQQTSANTAGIQTGIAPTDIGIQSGIANTSRDLQYDINDPRQRVRYDVAAPTTQTKGAVDARYNQSGQQVADALYRKQTAMLDPQYQQQQSDLTARLANQGIMPGSEAYNREMDNFARQRDFAYSNARDSAITAGGAEQSRLFNMGLSEAQLANSVNAQQFGQEATRTQMANQANAQEFDQNAAKAAFNNATQGQEFAQNAQRAEFNNQAQNQQFGQNAAQAGLNNSAIAQMFGQQLQANNQNFNQDLASANLANQGRQQAIQEQAYLRQLPLNEINALRSGAQINTPQFQQFMGQQVGATPVSNAAQQQGSWNQGVYNSQMAASNANTQAAATAAAAAIAAGFF